MNILPQTNESFDAILLNCKTYSKEFLKQRLEIYDLDIFSSIDKNRFKVIRIDERTILTSCGIITFKRRYYLDLETNKYVYLLDNQLGIPKNVRLSNELLLKILDLASIMTYAEVGKHLSDEFELSKFSIWKAIQNTVIELYDERVIDRKNWKVHVQIDEKFINMNPKKKRNEKCISKNKKRYYTLTIFAGTETYGNKGKRRLLNKTLLSSASLKHLIEKLNYILQSKYRVDIDEEIFVSGDFAKYIQTFPEKIFCNAVYVPDKYHAFKAIHDALPDLHVDSYSLNDLDFQNYLIKQTINLKDDNMTKVRYALYKNSKIFAPYLDPEYLGCSQEGQNSHVYAPRFGKYANRFNPETVEKLSLVREACATGSKIIVTNSKRITEKRLDLTIYPEIKITLDEPLKYVLDTRGMKNETRKLFDAIKYGGL